MIRTPLILPVTRGIGKGDPPGPFRSWVEPASVFKFQTRVPSDQRKM